MINILFLIYEWLPPFPRINYRLLCTKIDKNASFRHKTEEIIRPCY